MAQPSLDILFISVVILFMALGVLVILLCVLRRSQIRKTSKLTVCAGQPPLQIVVQTTPEQTQQLMDYLLDRVLLPEKDKPESEAETVETEEQTHQKDSVLKSLPKKLSQWITKALPLRRKKETEDGSDPLQAPSADRAEDDQHPSCSSDEPKDLFDSCEEPSFYDCSTDNFQHDPAHPTTEEEKQTDRRFI